MIKYINFLLLGLIISSSYGQSEPLEISEVVSIENSTQTELYNRGKQIFITAFNDANAVIQLDDEEKGIIIGKGNISYSSRVFSGSALTEGRIGFILSLEFKEGRYRYILKNFTHYGAPGKDTDFGVITTDEEFPYGKVVSGSSKKWNNKVWSDIKLTIEESTMSLISRIKEGMIQSVVTENDDW